jgi:hypothetical protein
MYLQIQVHDKNRFYLSNCLKGSIFITAGRLTCGYENTAFQADATYLFFCHIHKSADLKP